MTTIQSPSHALGLMVMDAYQKVLFQLPECIINVDGPKKIYPLIMGVDALLYSYRETMSFTDLDQDGKPVSIRYWQKIALLRKEEKELKFGNPTYGGKWVKWFHEYLVLLSSCFNHLGLAPALENEEILDDAIIEPADDNFIGNPTQT